MLKAMDFSFPTTEAGDIRAQVNKQIDSDTEAAKKNISSIATIKE